MVNIVDGLQRSIGLSSSSLKDRILGSLEVEVGLLQTHVAGFEKRRLPVLQVGRLRSESQLGVWSLEVLEARAWSLAQQVHASQTQTFGHCLVFADQRIEAALVKFFFDSRRVLFAVFAVQLEVLQLAQAVGFELGVDSAVLDFVNLGLNFSVNSVVCVSFVVEQGVNFL